MINYRVFLGMCALNNTYTDNITYISIHREHTDTIHTQYNIHINTQTTYRQERNVLQLYVGAASMLSGWTYPSASKHVADQTIATQAQLLSPAASKHRHTLWAPTKKQRTMSRTAHLPSTTGQVIHTAFVRDLTDTFMLIQKAAKRTSAVYFEVRLNGHVVVGESGSKEKWDRIMFSCSTELCADADVVIQRFQLPSHHRYQGLGPRILHLLIQQYRKNDCNKIIVAHATKEGASLYRKLGFQICSTSNQALSEMSLLLRPVKRAKCTDTTTTPLRISIPEQARVAEHTVEDSDADLSLVQDNSDSSCEVIEIDQDKSDSSCEVLPADEAFDSVAQITALTQKGTGREGYVLKPAGSYLRTKNALKVGAGVVEKLSDNDWDVKKHGEQLSDDSPYFTMTERRSGKSFNVIINRLGKAKQKLSHESCMNPMQLKSCVCRRKCHRLILDPEVIREMRTPIFVNCYSEAQVNAYIIDRLSVTNGKTMLVSDSGSSMHKVCPTYYAAVFGIAENRVKALTKKGRNKIKVNILSNNGLRGRHKDAVKYNLSHSFWHLFFESNCQRPNDEIRLFPTEKSYKEIYSEYFEPWFSRQVQGGNHTAEQKPQFSTWKSARRDPAFQDVKERAKHTHSRCNECATLSAMLLEAFKDGAAELEYRQRRRLHDEEVNQYRKLEGVVKARAVSTPEEVLVIMHDGTVALGLPKLTHRSIKNLDPARMEVVPWLGMDMSGGRKDYIYSKKATTMKDANTLISQVHAMIRRAKSDYSHVRHKARELILIADSASENKNNILFAYCTDMVEHGWFDFVDLIFGPVGHTHNGVDSVHKIHNQNVGAHLSGDLGHFVYNYPKGFIGHHSKMPSVTILERTVDWTAYYKDHLRPIAGFTKTKNDKIAVRGFRIARGLDKTVDLRWKVDPASEQEWRGAGGYPGCAGFFMLKNKPTGLPNFVEPPILSIEQKDTAKRLLSKAMKDILSPQGLLPCVGWNYEAATEAHFPIHAYLEDQTPAGEWGRQCELGAVEGKRGRVRILRDYWDASLGVDAKVLWMLPSGHHGEHIAATSNIHHFSGDQDVLSHRALPMVRYRGETRRNCEVAQHGNNVDGGWRREQSASNRRQASSETERARETAPDADRPQQPPDDNSAREAITDADAGVEHSATEQVSQTENDAPPETEWYFEEDFDQCKEGSIAVGLAETAAGPSPYIFVGQILNVNQSERTISVQPFSCTEDPWKEICVQGRWRKQRQNKENPPVTYPHFSVLKYTDKLNKNGTMPVLVKKSIESRQIKWSQS